jgi:hypothetical protein
MIEKLRKRDWGIMGSRSIGLTEPGSTAYTSRADTTPNEAAMRAGIPDLGSLSRSLLFALTGIAFFVFWFVARPSNEMTASMQEWPHVLWFSATLMTLAVALPVFGRMVGGPTVARAATIAGAGVGVSSVANIFEDGFRIEAFFFVFILGVWILDLAALAVAILIARSAPGRYRLLALIPAGTLAGILLFTGPGGPIMLPTWLAAAGVAWRIGGSRSPVPAARSTT